MVDRAHIRKGVLIRTYNGEKGKIICEDGTILSPVIIGSSSGADKIVPVIHKEDDKSTRSMTTVTRQTIVTDEAVTMLTLTIDKPDTDITPLVNAERDRRVSSGIPFNGKVFDFDQNGKDNITGAATLAKFAMIQGATAGNYRWANPKVDFSWITQDNTMMLLDAPSMSALGDIAAGWTTSHFVAARLIKDMSPIPEDFTDDKYWPR